MIIKKIKANVFNPCLLSKLVLIVRTRNSFLVALSKHLKLVQCLVEFLYVINKLQRLLSEVTSKAIMNGFENFKNSGQQT